MIQFWGPSPRECMAMSQSEMKDKKGCFRPIETMLLANVQVQWQKEESESLWLQELSFLQLHLKR